MELSMTVIRSLSVFLLTLGIVFKETHPPIIGAINLFIGFAGIMYTSLIGVL
ncbi:MAG: hypothetical protein ACOCQR_00205 [bacterium]